MAERPSVLVLGSGVSGLVTALDLAERGLSVTVLEASPFPGGRTSSWIDARGRAVDTGLHVVADHYVNMRRVLQRVGAYDTLHWWPDQFYLRAGKRPIRWQVDDLPPPFHLFRSTLGMSLPFGQAMAAGGAAFDAACRTHEDLAELDGVTYREWLVRHGVQDPMVLEFADNFADAATFLPASRASARAVLSWMKLLTRSSTAGRVSTWTAPLSEGLVAPLVRAIAREGGALRVSTAVVGFEVEGGRVRAVLARRSSMKTPCFRPDGSIDVPEDAPVERLAADLVVSALPMQCLRRVMPPALAYEAGLSFAFSLDTIGAMSVRLWFDRRIDPGPPGCSLVGKSFLRNLVDFSALYGPSFYPAGSVISFLIGDGRAQMERPDAEIIERVHEEFRAVWPPSREAKLADAVVDRIPAAMIAATPGSYERRPFAKTRLANLFLAGDSARHTASSSMEGATVAGHLAASALLESLGHDAIPILDPPDPPVVTALQRLRKRWLAAPPSPSPSPEARRG